MSAPEEGVPVARAACTFHIASYFSRCAENVYALHGGRKCLPEALDETVPILQVHPRAVDLRLRPLAEVVYQRRPVAAKIRRNTQPLAAHVVLHRLQRREQRSTCSTVGLRGRVKRAGGRGEILQKEDTLYDTYQRFWGGEVQRKRLPLLSVIRNVPPSRAAL